MSQMCYNVTEEFSRRGTYLKVTRADQWLTMRVSQKHKDRVKAMMDKHEKNQPDIVKDAIDEKFTRDFPKGLPKKKSGA